jgi:hypothetical protein
MKEGITGFAQTQNPDGWSLESFPIGFKLFRVVLVAPFFRIG